MFRVLKVPAATATVVLPVIFVIAPTATAAPPGGDLPSSPLSAAPVEVVRDGVTLLHQRTPVAGRVVSGRGPTRADFDGDGVDDIAAFSNAGAVVTYSSAPLRDLLSTELVGGSGCACFGSEMVTGNFDGDRYDDLAVGDYSEADVKENGVPAGGVWVFRGGPGGLRVDEVKHVNQSTPGVPGFSASSDWFGWSLAAGDITGDGKDDLVIGVPLKAVAGRQQAGAVVVLRGGFAGIVTRGAQWIDQNTAGVPDSAEAGDHFGYGVAVGMLNQGKNRDVVIGAPGERIPTQLGEVGLVTQFWGSSTGVSSTKVTVVSGLAASEGAQRKDVWPWGLGGTLAVADTTGDGVGEVVVGAAAAQVGSDVQAGAVISLPVRSTGLSVSGMIVLSQRDQQIAGTAESDDRFGDAIAAGDATGDGIADVLVGVPGDDVGTAVDAGSVVLLRGSRTGLTGVRSQPITQSSAGVPGAPERNDGLGSAVSLLNLDGARGLDAAIGTPGEMVFGDRDEFASGTVTTLISGDSGLVFGGDVSGRSLGVGGAFYGGLAHQ